MTVLTATNSPLRLRQSAFWGFVGLLCVLKLFLVSDTSVQIIYGPHDDSLYVERAFYLMEGKGFGPYDSRTLIKYPGISFWLAGTRMAGIPFLVSVNLLYIGAGLYVLAGLLRAGVTRWIALCAFALWLFNPITLGYEWARVIREPLGTGLLALMAGAMLHMFVASERGRWPWLHLGVFALVFAFTRYLREDDQLLWGLLALFVAALCWQLSHRGHYSKAAIAMLVAAAIVPAALAKSYELWYRGFVEAKYGLPIVNDFAEGEFPRLLATIRSVHSEKDNRLVMVTQEALQKLRVAVPEFRPAIDRLPPPGPGTFSCRMQGVCSEWSNGWMLFWIKEEASHAGLTPSLPAAQEYFRRVREHIERACSSGALLCAPKGQGLIPPMELRWTRAFVAEAFALAKMTLAPDPYLTRPFYLEYVVLPELAKKFQRVTMADQLEENSSPLSTWRERLAGWYKLFAVGLLLAGVAGLAVRLLISDRVPLQPVGRVAAVIGIYSLARLGALAYVAVYMGPFVPRLVFATYAIGVFLALPLLAETLNALSRSRRLEESK